MDYINIIGQILGVITIPLGFLSYQAKTAKKLLILQVLNAFVFCIHYLMIGAISAFAMNAIVVIRNIVYANKDKKIFSYRFYPILFAIIMGGVGILSWQNAYSIFVVLGLVLNTLALSSGDAQYIRKSILVTSTMVLIYNILVFSIGGTVYESVTIVSSIIGIIRYRKDNSKI